MYFCIKFFFSILLIMDFLKNPVLTENIVKEQRIIVNKKKIVITGKRKIKSVKKN
jgi:hypothetical protein